jgi:hypothetical protein
MLPHENGMRRRFVCPVITLKVNNVSKDVPSLP